MKSRFYGDARLLRMLAREAKGSYRHLAALFALAMMTGPLMVLMPIPMRVGIDNVLGDAPLIGPLTWVVPEAVRRSKDELLIAVITMILIINFLVHARSMVEKILRTYTGQHLKVRFQNKMFQHSQKLSLGFHDKTGVADSLYRIQYDAQALDSATVHGIIPLIGSVTWLVLMVVMTAIIDVNLTLVALSITPIMMLAANIYRRALRKNWTVTKQLESLVLGVVQEVLANMRVVQAFGQEHREQQRFRNRAFEAVRARVKVARLDGMFGVITGMSLAAGSAVVFYVGVNHVQDGRITLGQLMQVIVYLAMLYPPLQTLTITVVAIQQALASANRSYALLDVEPTITEDPGAQPITRARGDVEFRNVVFSYHEKYPTLHRISFRAPPGSSVGISGETGSGKTTLISLLMRFYDPTEGQILLDGVDVREYRLSDLRHQFAIVLQDSVLFSTTIAENIAYGRPEASEEQIIEAARLANAHEFISAFPDGYRTEVGERGMRLSGGERQRIALARAFLRDSAILILDEPTSSVDVGTEELVMEAIERLMTGRTTFLISHRPNTLDRCDVRLLLDRGRLATV